MSKVLVETTDELLIVFYGPPFKAGILAGTWYAPEIPTTTSALACSNLLRPRL